MLGAGAIVGGKRGWVLLERRAELRIERCSRVFGGSEECILAVQSNLAITYKRLGRLDESIRLRQDVYSGLLKLHGEEHGETLVEACNYASILGHLERYAEAKTVLRKTMPVARRVLGEGNDLTLRLRWNYAKGLYKNSAATLDDLREAVNTLEDAGRTARQVLGGAHPLTEGIEGDLRRSSRAILTAATRK